MLSLPRAHFPALRTALAAALGVTVSLTRVGFARDILRSGGATSTAASASAAGGNVGVQAGAISARTSDTLSRTTQALQSVRRLQDAARAVARGAAGSVPNGLVPGGLQVAPNMQWAGASQPVESNAGGRSLVTIRQNEQQAFLSWRTFNVGKETTVMFDQSAGGADAGTWIAFNAVNDPSGVPSKILGSIQADGQVYIINQNGIIFGGASQVNVHTLVASSLPINGNLLGAGILNNPDAQFLFSALPQSAGSKGTPAFTPEAAHTANGKPGDVVVEAGAVISSPTDAAHTGGRIVLAGANVTNNGMLLTPDGQTILAAGMQVGFAAHASGDPTLRGLDVYIGTVDADSGAAINNGLIEAERGNVTMAGKAVNQLGAIYGTTSVSLNGRIDLLANYGAMSNSAYDPINYPEIPPYLFQSAGTVTLGAGSVTEILPETWQSASVVAGQWSDASRSVVNLQGMAVYLGSNATILAPNGKVNIDAGLWNYRSLSGLMESEFLHSAGQIYLDAGATIDVAGSANVEDSVENRIVSVQLLGAELADSPTQRYSLLRGKTIKVDLRQSGSYNGKIWVGTPLADMTGYAGLIQRSVGQLTISGGSVSLNAGESVVLQAGAKIDVSGGWLNTKGGTVATTRMLSGGHLYDISEATPDLVYDGIYSGFTATHSRWNVSHTYTSALLSGKHVEAGYVQGGDVGSISITAPGMALDGELYGNAVMGPRQRASAPVSGALSIAFEKQDVATLLAVSPTPPRVVFQSGVSQAVADAFALDDAGHPVRLRADRIAEVSLSPDLMNRNGFGSLTIINSDGGIVIPAEVSISGEASGALTLSAARLDVEGKVTLPGGSISLTVYDYSPYALQAMGQTSTGQTPAADFSRGLFTLGANASLDVSGLIVDDRNGLRGAESLPLVTAGGGITIKTFSADLEAGSRLDVSGGVAIAGNGKRVYGNAGTLTIQSGQDPMLTSLVGGRLMLGAELNGYAGLGAQAGALAIQASLIQIGGATADADTLRLAPEFFNRGGFGGFTLSGIGAVERAAVVVSRGTVIAPEADSWLAVTDAGSVRKVIARLPEGVRSPVNVTLSAPGVVDYFTHWVAIRGDMVMEAGASIRTDAKGNVTLSGNTVSVNGSITAPGGMIAISGGANSTLYFADQEHALPTVEIRAGSVISTAGTTVLIPDARGYRTGSVLAGGAITISGNIVAEAGAVLNVSGASGVLDLQPTYGDVAAISNGSLCGQVRVGTTVESNGGSITLTGKQALFSDATLLGRAGGTEAQGGNLEVSSGRFIAPNSGEVQTPLDVTLEVTQRGPTLPRGEAEIGMLVTDAGGNPLEGIGHLSVDRFEGGGFSSLTLGGVVRFSGEVAINMPGSLTVATGGIIYGDAAIRLSAPYVAIGTAFNTPQDASQIQSPFQFQGSDYPVSPTYGAGKLSVAGRWIDIGYLSLQRIGSVSFDASAGEIRGNGILDVAGAISMTAGQIYPTTATRFTIAAYDYIANGGSHAGSVTIHAGSSRALPLSAGDELNVYGSVIDQSGVLRAPLGTIHLGWDGMGTAPADLLTGGSFGVTQKLTLGAGSMTSVSAVDPLTGDALTIPYGVNLNGASWIDPAGNDISTSGVPAKAIAISAVHIDDRAGSTIDLRGGGDLYAYRFVAGNGGSSDLLASGQSFAVIAGYSGEAAPYAPFNSSPLVTSNLNGDAGYASSGLKVGDRVFLSNGSGLPAGYYTLLPSRYALLPGAFLVTPMTGVPTGTAVPLTDGATLVSGYRVNGFAPSQPLVARFEVAPAAVMRARAEYEDYSANGFFEGSNSMRRPADSGQLVLAATRSMNLQGSVLSVSTGGGRGGLIDISSPLDILITNKSVSDADGQLVLDAGSLSAFGAESLLIGGVRNTGAEGTSVTVNTNRLTLDNAGTPLTGADLILVAREHLTLAAGAEIESSGALPGGAETLQLGTAQTAGDGLLVRVSSAPGARVERSAISHSSARALNIGTGVRLGGGSVILDSSDALSLDPHAELSATAVSLHSGQISILLEDPGALEPGSGLVLSGEALASLQQNATRLTLLSYSSLDFYGAGQIGALDANGRPQMESLALEAGEIRGFHNAGGKVTLSARELTLGNSASGQGAGAVASAEGMLVFEADVIRLGDHELKLDQFAQVELRASGGILAEGAGTLRAQGGLTLAAPLITGATAANETIAAGGLLRFEAQGSSAMISGGLGASLTLEGFTIDAAGAILLPSGNLTMHATGGNLTVAGRLDTAGSAQRFFDTIQYTNGGKISLIADSGDVNMAAGSVVAVAAQSGGGNAGSLLISVPQGEVNFAGLLLGTGGAGGVFSLDVGTLNGGSMGALDGLLNAGGFTASRSVRVRNGDVRVEGVATARDYNLSADLGSIVVAGTVDASGEEGGRIQLAAYRDLILGEGSVLTVRAQDFDSAGKGGTVSLETRGADGGVIDIRSGALIDLSVERATGSSIAEGNRSGTLHLRAPQLANGSDVQVGAIRGSILNASSVVVEGFNLYTPANGSIDSVKSAILSDGNRFLGSAGEASASYSAMWNRLLGADNAALAAVFNIEVGAEIVNPNGDLTLASEWDLSTYRFGPERTAGVLTLRAAGNLNFNFRASLSDGFDGSSNDLWEALLLDPGSASWSYRLVAGAAFKADGSSTADYRQLKALPALAAGSGSVLVGKGSPELPIATNHSRQSILPNYYQTIRTGSGDIDIYAGRDVQLLNSLATIYTAGMQADEMANFDLPDLDYKSSQLGATQTPVYPAQYSFGGGNVTIYAQNDIAHYLEISSGSTTHPVADSTRELPTNWLYRRGFVDPMTGLFAATHSGGEIESTSWWIDFSNFYEGIGALGGGNVTLVAGRDISNVDAAVPTNARMPMGTPDAARLAEYGGGDLVVRAGHDVDGGVYYVERGTGIVAAGNRIHTNATRAALTYYEVASLKVAGRTPDSTTWLPTTLFLGKGSFEISAGDDLLLGTVANPFLLPQGINNSFYEKTYFSTYAASDAVSAVSLTGDVILNSHADGGAGSLEQWYQNVLLYYGNTGSYSYSQPWLRLAETSITPFARVMALLPGTLRATAFAGDIRIVGDLTFAPSPRGTVDFAAAGSIDGLQVNGVDWASGDLSWSTSTINLSDADPSRIPGIASPLTLSGSATGFQGGTWNYTQRNLFDSLNALFAESGSMQGAQGVLQTQQALHASPVLHAGDAEPVRFYAGSGDISGVTLFSPKASRIVAGADISDVAFYLQNTAADDWSLIAAGRDLIAYDPGSALRDAARKPGNLLELNGSPVLPLAGDLQISGPGTLEVLAGRNLDLGAGNGYSDGTGLGITSIGNGRNPALGSSGADLVVAAGIGASTGLSGSQLDFDAFIARFLDPAGSWSARYLPELGRLLGVSNGNDARGIWARFGELPVEQRCGAALEIFYLVLRDAGRDFNTASSAGYRNYDLGFQAIAALFPGDAWSGDLSLASREIKTLRGGDIAIFAPGGDLTVGYDLSGHQPVDQGILTEAGGNISIFTQGDVIVGTSRIFTLRGGNETIWSSAGDIAAGASSKTVQAAPPTRVLIDPQSANTKTDLAGLATGGGIGVLGTVEGVPPGDVDLVAPAGVIDAGDAGVRVSGNLNLAAAAVLNAGNIQVAGASSGVPSVVAPTVNAGGLASALTTAGAMNAAVEMGTPVANAARQAPVELPSILTVEVIGYGGEE